MADNIFESLMTQLQPDENVKRIERLNAQQGTQNLVVQSLAPAQKITQAQFTQPSILESQKKEADLSRRYKERDPNDPYPMTLARDAYQLAYQINALASKDASIPSEAIREKQRWAEWADLQERGLNGDQEAMRKANDIRARFLPDKSEMEKEVNRMRDLLKLQGMKQPAEKEAKPYKESQESELSSKFLTDSIKAQRDKLMGALKNDVNQVQSLDIETGYFRAYGAGLKPDKNAFEAAGRSQNSYDQADTILAKKKLEGVNGYFNWLSNENFLKGGEKNKGSIKNYANAWVSEKFQKEAVDFSKEKNPELRELKRLKLLADMNQAYLKPPELSTVIASDGLKKTLGSIRVDPKVTLIKDGKVYPDDVLNGDLLQDTKARVNAISKVFTGKTIDEETQSQIENFLIKREKEINDSNMITRGLRNIFIEKPSSFFQYTVTPKNALSTEFTNQAGAYLSKDLNGLKTSDNPEVRKMYSDLMMRFTGESVPVASNEEIKAMRGSAGTKAITDITSGVLKK